MDRLTRKSHVGEYLPKNHIAVIHTDTKSEENLTNIFEKLGQYEDLEEQGLIVRLPFTAGETVYHLLPRQNGKYVIAETIADSFFVVLTAVDGRFGKTVFTNIETAKQKVEDAELK